MSLKQWVNLSKEEIFKDNTITTLDRCGNISAEITVDIADRAIGYRLRITPVGSNNVVYTPAELARNSNFYLTLGRVGVVDAKTIRVDDIRLPAAGGNKYKIEVIDATGKVVFSNDEVETWRRLYYQVVSMDDNRGNTVPSYSLANMETHAKKYFIELENKGTEQKMPYMKTIKMGEPDDPNCNLNQFSAAVRNAFTLDANLKKLGMAAVFSEYIAEISDKTVVHTVTIGTVNPLCVWSATEITVECEAFLWFGLDDADDLVKKWCIDGYVEYVDPAVVGSGQSYFIPLANIDITGAKRRAHGGYHKVKIRIDPNLQRLLSHRRGQVKITIKINVAEKWTNGFSWEPYAGMNLITCARRTVWEDMPAETREYTWNHEVGHRFGMTAWGHSTHGDSTLRNKLPDGPSTLYGENSGVNDNDHQGPHCSSGATYNVTTGWSGTPGCVMFGANGIGTAHSPNEYCGICAPIVRRLDLSA